MKLISLVLFSETWRNLYNLLVSVDNSCYNFVFVNLSNHYGLADAGKKNKMRLPILFISLQMQDYYTYNEKNSYHFLTLITAGWQSRNLLLRGPCFNCDRAPGPAHLKGGEGGGGGGSRQDEKFAEIHQLRHFVILVQGTPDWFGPWFGPGSAQRSSTTAGCPPSAARHCL